jgi:hypothetical protein
MYHLQSSPYLQRSVASEYKLTEKPVDAKEKEDGFWPVVDAKLALWRKAYPIRSDMQM